MMEKAMVPHSSTLSWRISWAEEPGGLQSMGLRRVGHDERLHIHFSLFTFMHWRRKWQPAPVFLPRESQGRGARWAAVYGVTQSRTRLKWLSSSSISRVTLLQSLMVYRTTCFINRCKSPRHHYFHWGLSYIFGNCKKQQSCKTGKYK